MLLDFDLGHKYHDPEQTENLILAFTHQMYYPALFPPKMKRAF
jgi:hypothetical protein